ncbi:MAG: signal peptide peptidase SppA [Campylobacterales bacterium]
MERLKWLFWPITAPIVFIQNHFKATLLVLIVILVVFSAEAPQPQPNLYRIDLRGPILDADGFLAEVAAAEEANVKGVLLVVDSPGGSVPPSVEMMMAVRELSGQKPVVAYAAGVMASGSYYASIWADEIIANPGSIVGSIGVLMEGVNAAKLLDTVGVEMNVVKAGELKEAGTFYRDWTQAERAQLEGVTASIYEMFVRDVAEARELNATLAPEFANGRIFTAAEALEHGLVDTLGSIKQAETQLALLAGVDSPVWNEPDELEAFFQMLQKEARAFVFSLIAPSAQMRL